MWQKLLLPFDRFACWTARAARQPLAFIGAVALIRGWAVTGPHFGFSNTWQRVITRCSLIGGRGRTSKPLATGHA